MFNIFNNNPDIGFQCSINMFADETKLGGAVDPLETKGLADTSG